MHMTINKGTKTPSEDSIKMKRGTRQFFHWHPKSWRLPWDLENPLDLYNVDKKRNQD